MTHLTRISGLTRPGLIFFGRGFNFEIFLDIYFLRIIKNSWLLWRLFAARDVRLGHSMYSTFLYCTKNEDLIMKCVCFCSTDAVTIIKVDYFNRSNGVTSMCFT